MRTKAMTATAGHSGGPKPPGGKEFILLRAQKPTRIRTQKRTKTTKKTNENKRIPKLGPGTPEGLGALLVGPWGQSYPRVVGFPAAKPGLRVFWRHKQA